MKRLAIAALVADMKYIPAKALLRVLSAVVGLALAGMVTAAQGETITEQIVNYCDLGSGFCDNSSAVHELVGACFTHADCF